MSRNIGLLINKIIGNIKGKEPSFKGSYVYLTFTFIYTGDGIYN